MAAPRKTQRLHRSVGAWTLNLSCSVELEAQGVWLLDWLIREDTRHGGHWLDQNMQIRVGWSEVHLRAAGAQLIVCAPDFGGKPGEPLRWTPDLSHTLRVQAEQAGWIAAFGLEAKAQYARYDDTFSYSDGVFAEKRVALLRGRPAIGDSGWSLRPSSKAVSSYKAQRAPVWHIVRLRPALLQALMLPPAWSALFEGDKPVQVRAADGTDVTAQLQAGLR